MYQSETLFAQVLEGDLGLVERIPISNSMVRCAGGRFNLSVFLLLAFAGLTACTRKVNDSKLTIQLPALQASSFNQSNKVSTTSLTVDEWNDGLDPVDETEINCYMVVVGASSPGFNHNYCKTDDETQTFYFGPWRGAVTGGSVVELDLPSGTGRKVMLFGFNASDPAYCTNFRNDGPEFTELSHPYLVAQKTVDLQPGTTALNLTVSLTASLKLNECDVSEVPDMGNSGVVGSIVQLSAGANFTCGMTDLGEIKCWGSGSWGELGNGANSSIGDGSGEMGSNLVSADMGTGRSAYKIASGWFHSCALLDNDDLKCWGKNANGQLGIGNTLSVGNGPGQMGDSLAAVDLGTGRFAVQVSAGYAHTCALLDNGAVKCWGFNTSGQLGLGHTNTIGDTPAEMGDSLSEVDLGTGRTAVLISAGYDHTCAVLDNDTLKCWGNNSDGQLGMEHTSSLGDGPGEMGDALIVVSLGAALDPLIVEAGNLRTCAQVMTGETKCWGSNFAGVLGNGTTTLTYGGSSGQMGSALPLLSIGADPVVFLAKNIGSHMCGIDGNFDLKCWGFNGSGRLGLGNSTNYGDSAGNSGANLPIVNVGTGTSVGNDPLDIVTGDSHVCALFLNGLVKCWGGNSVGQLGLENTTNLGASPGHMGSNLPYLDLGN